MQKLDTVQVAARVRSLVAAYNEKPEQIAVDTIGIGAGVADMLRGWYPDETINNRRTGEFEVRKIVASPELSARLTAMGLRPVGSTAQELADVMARDLPKWSRIVKDAKITLE